MSKKKEPWEECPDVWPTKAAYFNYLRGCLRLAWKRHPVKIKFLNESRFKAPIGKQIDKKTGQPKMVWAGTCDCCGGTFRTGNMQVDHREGAGSFRGWDDMTAWVQGLMRVNIDDLDYVCKPCHEIKSYADKEGLTFEEAVLEKDVIKFKNLKATPQKRKLTKLGITPAGNGEQRVQQYREYINATS